jgi:hypothetical protein
MRTALVAGLLVWVACVDRGAGPQPRKIDPAYVAAHLLARPPAALTPRLDVALGGGQVVYLGNAVDRTTVVPGQTVRITHYWQVVRPIGAGWKVFAMVRGAPGTADFLNLPATDMELGHDPAHWQAGEVIEDVQDIALRPASTGSAIAWRRAAPTPRTAP